MTSLRPFAPLALAGAAAVSAGALWRFTPAWSVFLLTLAISAIAIGLGRTKALLFAAPAIPLLFLVGCISASEPTAKNLVFGESRRYRGEIAEDPTPGDRGYRALVRIEGVAPAEPEGVWEPAEGIAMVTLGVQEGGGSVPALGDRLIFRTTLSPTQGFRNPGTLWRELYLRRKSVAARGFAELGSTALLARPGSGEARFSEYRRKMAEAVRASSPGRSGAALASITLGDRSGIDRETVRLFVDTGTIHLLSVSGLHLSIVMLLSMALIRVLLSRFPTLLLRYPAPSLSRLAALLPVGAYATVAGLGPATLRSLLMLTVVAVAGALSRRTSMFAVLCTSFFVIVLLSPLSVTDPGLQLSFAAIASLFWLYPALHPQNKATQVQLIPDSRWKRLGKATLSGLAALGGATLAATLATAPLAAFHFGQGGWSGVFYNCLAVPLSGFVTLPASLAGALIYPLLPQLAEVIWKVAGFSMEFLFRAMELVKPPSTSLFSEPFATLWGLAGAYLALLGVLLSLRRSKGWAAALGFAALCLFAPKGVEALASKLDQGSSLYVFDVGDGLSAAFRLPDGRWAVVDGGGVPGSDYDVGEEVVWRALRSLGCGKIDLVISTHPHPDHLTGLPSLVRLGRAREVVLPASFAGDERYGELRRAAAEVGARVVEAGPEGFSEVFGEFRLRAFGGRGEDENDRSLMVEGRIEPTRVLIGGDVGAAAQERLLSEGGVSGPAQVYVAAHHGLASAVSERFYGELKPEVTLVSCGERWGGPSGALSALAEKQGSVLYATRYSGCLTVNFDRGGYRVAASAR